ncbi:MAG TPA: hypothetical protein VGC82_04265, partial [Rhodopila sp.]
MSRKQRDAGAGSMRVETPPPANDTTEPAAPEPAEDHAPPLPADPFDSEPEDADAPISIEWPIGQPARQQAPEPPIATPIPQHFWFNAEPAAAIAEAPKILIDIDQEVSAALVFNRFDLKLRGRVVSAAAIDELELLNGEDTIVRMNFGKDHSATQVPLDGNELALQHDYLITLPRLQEQAAEPCKLTLRARTDDGHVHDQAFELAIDLNQPKPVTVVSGPTRPSRTDVWPHIVLYVERALVGSDGALMVLGWTIASTPIFTVQGFTAEGERLPAARIGLPRDDVASVYPAYPQAGMAGFSMSARLDPAKAAELTAVRVQSICRNGYSHEVTVPVERVASIAATLGPPAPIPGKAPPVEPRSPKPQPDFLRDPRRKIYYYGDIARVALDGTVTVLGWAVCAVGIANIGIYIDGVKVGDAQLALPRPDIAGEFPNNPMAHLSGFRYEARVPELAGGIHELLIVVRNGMDDVLEETDTITFNPPVEPRSAPSAEPSEFRFELDNPRVVDGVMAEPVTGRLTIEGWVVAQSGISHIEVRLGGQHLAQAHYGLARQDVGIAFPEMPSSLRSGYAFHCPPRSLRSGTHVVTLTVHAKNGMELVHRFDIEVKRPDGE